MTGVYFIRDAGAAGPVKIGFASNIRSRFAGLQTANHQQLVVLGVLEGDGKAIEKGLHSQFSTDRIRGEWFRASKNLLAFIKNYTTTWTPDRKRQKSHGQACSVTLNPVGVDKILALGRSRDIPEENLSRLIDEAIAEYVERRKPPSSKHR